MIPLFSSLAFSDVIVLRDGITATVKIVDTAGSSITYERNGSEVTLKKCTIAFIVFGADTIAFDSVQSAKNEEAQSAAPVAPDSSAQAIPVKKSVTDTGTMEKCMPKLRLSTTMKTGYSAPIMQPNGTMTGGGAYPVTSYYIEAGNETVKLNFLADNLKPYLNPKSDAVLSLNKYQGQKIGAICCYIGCVAGVLTALFAGQEKTGESYGYDPNSNSFKNTPNYKITPIFAPMIVLSAVCLPTGLALQFTAKRHLFKAIEIHNSSVTKNALSGIRSVGDATLFINSVNSQL